VAKKVRTPPPPRRVQAPKRRESPVSPEAARRQRMILYGLAASGIVLLGAVLLFLAFVPRGNGDEGLAQTIRAAGGTLQTFKSEGRNHVQSLDEDVDYKTDPPTSGPHYFSPAVWGIYDRPLNQVQAVHNLEHGGIVIQYGDDIPQAEVQKIADFYRDDPNGMLVAPLPRLGDEIALTAWTHMAKVPRFDQEAFEAFRDTYRGEGPEPFDVDDLQPGTNT
jgi:hypothetical protein